MLCGLVSVLTRDELLLASDILNEMQAQGNRQAPEVWNSLWRQWGRLDPETGMTFFNAGVSDKTATEARSLMTGWLEKDAAAAITWAWKPGKTTLEASAAALAITQSSTVI